MGIISAGDFIDIFYKIKTRGLYFMMGKISLLAKNRTKNTWNNIDDHSSNWWNIEAVRKRWNKLITDDPEKEYEDYIVDKYLKNKNDISILSVGCGNGSHEIKFANYPNIKKVTDIDMASKPLKKAKEKALNFNITKLSFLNSSFENFTTTETFDLILFHSSLHHFKNTQNTLLKTTQLLNHNGLLVINEYTGPNKFQFGKQRKTYLNKIIKTIPDHLKRRLNSNNIKNRIYESGTLRMYIADPSEAVNSSVIMQCLNRQFNMLEEKKTGGDILHYVLKDIAHNFLPDDIQANHVLQELFKIEDEFIQPKKYSDFMFGIYRKKQN